MFFDRYQLRSFWFPFPPLMFLFCPTMFLLPFLMFLMFLFCPIMFLFCSIMFLLLLSFRPFCSFLIIPPQKNCSLFAHKCSYLMFLILNIIKEASCFFCPFFSYIPTFQTKNLVSFSPKNVPVVTNIVSYSRNIHFYT